MKFSFYTNLNDNFSASNCRDICKQKAQSLSPPQSYKVSKKLSRNRVKPKFWSSLLTASKSLFEKMSTLKISLLCHKLAVKWDFL